MRHAKRSIELFDELLGEHSEEVPGYWVPIDEGDAYYYPAIHYFGAIAAANAGNTALALRWAEKNRRLVPGDNFGARYLLAALYLNSGRPSSSIEKLCKASHRNGWEWTCVAAAAASESNKSKALRAIATLLVNDWAPLEVYSKTWPQLRAWTRPSSNQGTPAFFQEVEYRTRPFWAQTPRVRKLFQEVCNDKEIRRSALAHHKAQRLRWGMAFLKPGEQERRTTQMKDAKKAFVNVLDQRLPAIWDEVMGA